MGDLRTARLNMRDQKLKMGDLRRPRRPSLSRSNNEIQRTKSCKNSQEVHAAITELQNVVHGRGQM